MDVWANTAAQRLSTNQVNLMDSTSNDFYITGVQLETGTQATPFEHRSYGDELARCMRFYEEASRYVSGVASPGGTDYATMVYKVVKRATPTIGYSVGHSSVNAIYTDCVVFTRSNDPADFSGITISAEL